MGYPIGNVPVRLAMLFGLALGVFGIPRNAQASPDYPPVLAEVIAEQYPNAVKCVPLCTACHLTTEGGGSPNKFGASLESFGLVPGNAASIEPAFVKLAAADPDSDGDGVHDVQELIAGDSPAIAGDAGKSQFCSDERFGCAARIAGSAPRDCLSLLGVGSALAGLAFARRKRVAARARHSAK